MFKGPSALKGRCIGLGRGRATVARGKGNAVVDLKDVVDYPNFRQQTTILLKNTVVPLPIQGFSERTKFTSCTAYTYTPANKVKTFLM